MSRAAQPRRRHPPTPAALAAFAGDAPEPRARRDPEKRTGVLGTLGKVTLLAGGLIAAPGEVGAEVTNIGTSGYLRGVAAASARPPQFGDSEFKERHAPPDFTSFNDSVVAVGNQDHVNARGTASQQSVLTAGDGTLTVTSNATTESRAIRTGDVDSDRNTGAGGIASFGVTFTITERSTFNLSGSISVTASGATGSSNTQVRFRGEEPIVDIEVEDEPGEPLQAGVVRTGVLEPGDYRLSVFTSTSLSITQSVTRSAWNITLNVVPSPLPPERDDIKWIGPTGGAFGNPDNWQPRRVPTKDDTRGDTARFERSGTLVVNLGGGAPAVALATPRAIVGPTRKVEHCLAYEMRSLIFTGGTLVCDALSVDEPSLSIDASTFLLNNAIVQSRSAVIGRRARALVEVSGAGRLESSARLAIGKDGPGTLRVSGGGFASALESRLGDGTEPGTAVVTGLGSRWNTANVAVGLASEGSLEVSDGGEVESNLAYLAYNPGVTGNATVKGVGSDGTTASVWRSATLIVGAEGPSRLTVSSGAHVTAARISIGGTGTASGTGSGSVVVSGGPAGMPSRLSPLELLVGNGGTGELRVEGGGYVQTVATTVGNQHVSSGGGHIVVGGRDDDTGRASLFSSRDDARIGAGREAVGEMVILTFGQVETGPAIVGGALSQFGRVALVGRNGIPVGETNWRVRGDLHVGKESQFGSKVQLFGASLDVEGDLIIGNQSKVDGSGFVASVSGNVIVEAGGCIAGDQGIWDTRRIRVAPGGGVCPGASPGTLTINGDLEVEEGGRILLEVAGPRPETDVDRLIVNGDATLGGTVVVQFMNGYAPKAGTRLELLTVSGATSSDTATIEVAGLAPGSTVTTDLAGGVFAFSADTDTVPLQTVALGPAKKKVKEKQKSATKLAVKRKGTKAEIALPLDVQYTVTGTATNGIDYQLLRGNVTIPAGKKSAKLAVQPIDDGDLELPETIEIALVPGSDYTLALKHDSVLTLVSDEKFPKQRRR